MKKYMGIVANIASKSTLVWMMVSTQALGFSVISYDGVPARWAEGKNIEIEIDTNFDPYIDESGCDSSGSCVSVYQTMINSINSWKSAQNTNINISKITNKTISGTPHYDGKNQVKVYTQGWSNLPFNPPTSALAVTISTYTNPNTIVDSDIFFNAETFEWAVVNSESEKNKYDIQNVLTHELGHFFGLDHTSEGSNEQEAAFFDATMFFASRPGETFRRSLEDQDVLGIQHLYTNQNLPQPVVDAFNPSVLEVNSQSTVIEITGSDFYPTASVVIVRNNDQGDINARIVSVESDRIVAKIPSSNLQTGDYEVVVANSYNKFVRTKSALSVDNPFVYGSHDQDAKASTGGSGCQSDNPSGLLLLLLPLLAMMTFKRNQISIRKNAA